MTTPPDVAPDGAGAYAHAILDAALDAIVTLDRHGSVLEFNPAAEQTFGYRREDVLGLDLAELVVPPEHREAHRQALARWTDDGPGEGAGGVLGRRLDVEAMRADGSLFPAELTISRIRVAGPPLFTASIRDVTDRREADERLARAEFRYRTLVEQLPLLTYVDSPDTSAGQPLYMGPQIEALLGYSSEEWMTTPNLYVLSIHPDDRARVLAEKRLAYETSESRRSEYRMLTRDGRVVWVEDHSVLVQPPHDGPVFRQGVAIDVTERKEAEDALRRAEVRFRTLVEHLPLTVYIDRADAESSNLYSSPQIESLLGYSPDEWTEDRSLFTEALHPDDRDDVRAAHAATRATGEPLNIEYRLLARDGRVVWVHDEARLISDPDGGAPVLQGYLLDITAQKEAEGLLRHQAFHDVLTGLPNRALFYDRVEHALVVRGESGGKVAVLFVDLDDFKTVNDSYGHPAGDRLLQEVAKRLRDAVAPEYTVARLGGDEFAILVDGEGGLPAAVSAAAALLARCHEPFEIDGREVVVTPSVGIALGRETDDLLRAANVAMYRAKASGGAQYIVHAPGMDEGVAGRLELVGDLRRARIAEEFVLHYQPTVDLATGGLVGLEALIRWRHPERGLLMPAEFIPLAEETGRIVEIGRWVLGEACRQARRWRDQLGSRALTVSVNVSPRQVRGPGLLEDVRAALERSGLEPSGLILEITESVLAGPRDDVAAVLNDVTAMGVDLALDDFGTGYSSLSLLQDLPVHTLKIDRAFVGALDTVTMQTAFVKAIVDLAQALGLKVVGEGIETPMQVNALRRLGCRVGQGFYFERPLELRELHELLADGELPTFPRRSGTRRDEAA